MTKNNNSESLGNYLKALGRDKLLTKGEEIELAEKIQCGRLKTSTEVEKKSALRSRNELVRRNLRLVVSVAKRYQNCGLEFDVLIQEGSGGLVRAAEKFNPKEGAKFSTYAYAWIRQRISLAIRKHSRTIRLPDYLHGRIFKLKRISAELSMEFERSPTREELSDRSGIALETMDAAFVANRSVLSLDYEIRSEDGGLSLFDVLAETKEAPAETLYAEQLRDRLNEILFSTSKRDREIFFLRRGLATGGAMSFDAIGSLYDLTRQRCQQIDSRLLKRLKSDSSLAMLQSFR